MKQNRYPTIQQTTVSNLAGKYRPRDSLLRQGHGSELLTDGSTYSPIGHGLKFRLGRSKLFYKMMQNMSRKTMVRPNPVIISKILKAYRKLSLFIPCETLCVLGSPRVKLELTSAYQQTRNVRGVIGYYGSRTEPKCGENAAKKGGGESIRADEEQNILSPDNVNEKRSVKLKSKKVVEMLNNAASFSEVQSTPQETWSTPPYPKDVYRRLQWSHAVRPKFDPKETSIIVFPGQGVQYVGMGKKLLNYPNVRRMYSIASEILGYNLLDICLNGPKEDLNKTLFCQPAVVVASLATVEKLKDESPHVVESCIGTAGFSVGEITALIFGGSLTFEDGMKLVRIRAEAMQGASELEPGGMMTVFYGADARIGFACHAAKEWCHKQGVQDPECIVANYLYPGCKVIAGNEQALKFITLNAKDFGIRRYKRLPVSGAFHTKLMTAAKEALITAMDSITVQDPVISVHSNVDGKRYRNAKHIKQQLPKQICAPVKWEQTLHVLYERPSGINFPKTYECGPGKSLSAILEKVNAKASESSYNFET